MYRIADVGVVPSLFEPFGYVPVEMMMHELPIVATATSGLNEVVDESCGLKVPLIVSPDNVEIDTSLLAQKIIYLLQNPKEAKRLGKNGRKRYLEKYSSEVFGKNMIAFYKSLFQECK
jgi:glycosyltransferase family 4